MEKANFDLFASYEALDKQRRERKPGWTSVAKKVNRFLTTRRPLAVTSMTKEFVPPSPELARRRYWKYGWRATGAWCVRRQEESIWVGNECSL